MSVLRLVRGPPRVAICANRATLARTILCGPGRAPSTVPFLSLPQSTIHSRTPNIAPMPIFFQETTAPSGLTLAPTTRQLHRRAPTDQRPCTVALTR